MTVFRYGTLQVLIYLPISLYLCSKKKLNSKLWIVLAFFIFLIPLLAWVNSPNGYYLFEGMGRNYVSVFAILSLSLVNIVCEKKGIDCPLWPAALVLAVSIFATGRGGIIAASVIFMLFFIRWSFAKKKDSSNKHLLRIVVAVLLMIIVIWFIYMNLDYVERYLFPRFFGYEATAVSSNTKRLYMYISYINDCLNSAVDFLFGADASLFSSVGTNMHNSYIQVHNRFGIVGFLFILFASIRSIFYLYRREMFYSVFIFIGILVRSFTDWCFPAFTLDFVLLYYICLPYFKTKKMCADKSRTDIKPDQKKDSHSIEGAA